MIRRFVCLSVAVVVLASIPVSAHAFSEDLCFDEAGPANCFTAVCLDGQDPDDCCEPDDESAWCKYRATVDLIATGRGSRAGRSMLHLDATYYLAQAVGFDPSFAYWIAAYDQAVDGGQYVAYDQCGEASLSASLNTAELEGIDRTSMSTAGASLHVSMPYSASSTPIEIDGLHPDLVDASHETLLFNARRWAFSVDDLCVMGLTNAPGTTAPASSVGCYHAWSGDDAAPSFWTPKLLQGHVPLLFGVALPYSSYLGNSILSYTTARRRIVGDPYYAAELDPITVDDALEGTTTFGFTPREAVRFGIYLHLLQDRISHHECGDASYMSAPDGYGVIELVYDQDECTQPLHALRHSWETGWGDTQPETTVSALRFTYEELATLATLEGLAPSMAEDDAVEAMVEALSVPDGGERLEVMVDAFDAAGFAQLPGHGISCS